MYVYICIHFFLKDLVAFEWAKRGRGIEKCVS